MIQSKQGACTPPEPGREPAWLLLVYQLPTRPSNARVKTWRRLQRVGALAVRNSVYVLPNSAQAREDLEWIKAEIAALKGQATVFAADGVDALSAEELAAAFRKARQREFEVIGRRATKLLASARRAGGSGGPLHQRLGRAARQLRNRWNEVAAIDFFGAPGRDDAAAVLEELEQQLAGVRARPGVEAGERASAEGFRGRIWVTRPRPGVDRMASAWLIRRFIDAQAQFAFAEGPDPASGGVPFDMFGVEFSHEGNHCTFETLAQRFGIATPGVTWLGQIVHDLDLKAEQYAPPEAAAVGRVIDGLRQMTLGDHELLEHGMTMFEALYRSFAVNPAPTRDSLQAGPRPQRLGRRMRA